MLKSNYSKQVLNPMHSSLRTRHVNLFIFNDKFYSSEHVDKASPNILADSAFLSLL